jgi:Glycosyl hydrolases family 2, TIM barrel domain/Glycosyl hydrolases family 2, sugar binding domain/Glycosyl hydrolases family 2/Beta galactosidase small chain
MTTEIKYLSHAGRLMRNAQRLKDNAKSIIVLSVQLCVFSLLHGQQTETQFLSGTGSDHTVNWQFYCTDGNNSGKWTTIPVPSNWELQGFGKYNYGLDKDSVRGKELGLYKYTFNVPAAWKSKTVRIVFEGSMTDTEVKINGKPAGATHRGSFYCFHYDISSLLKYGKQNVLEVTVSKHSSNESVNGAERRGDFWIFGGIFRPVYLQAVPNKHIEHVAVNALANGSFAAKLKLSGITTAAEVTAQLYTMQGAKAGNAFSAIVQPGDSVTLLNTTASSPRLWTPEFPNRYKVVVSLTENGKAIHTVEEKFGFRTIELRERDGIYLNNVKVKFKGVCRHSFRPETGRALNETNSIEDVMLIKSMNMNAVRMSHYPPDDHFLDACDSLGLMVLDELAGWHRAYDTQVGTQLVKEMVAFDGNHPSIVMWDNGNEGGSNNEVDVVFDEMDFQHRPLIHPWQRFRSTDTQHYINFDYGNGTNLHGHDIVFPTEFLHGLYDGGLGAGLEDYWDKMWHHPLSAGGFLWVFADEGVVRTDKNGLTDNDGNHAPDGILGPHHEKEGSYYAIKEIWSPIYFEQKEITEKFDGRFRIENRYHFTNLKQCFFLIKWATLPKPGSTMHEEEIDTIPSPDIAPGEWGTFSLELVSNSRIYDVLYINALDPQGNEIYTWSWPLKKPSDIAGGVLPTTTGTVSVSQQGAQLIAKAAASTITFNAKTGLLEKVETSKGVIPISNGPVLSEGDTTFTNMTTRQENGNVIIESGLIRNSTFQSLQWTIYPSGWVKMQAKFFPKEYEFSLAGINFSFPESTVKEIEWMGNGPYRVWKNRMKGTTLNAWKKAYNNTATGEGELIYPEFKGYFSNFYWMKLITTGQPLTVVCANEDVFLRLFTPKFSLTPFNTAPAFPAGDLSFMVGISAIGTKSQKPDRTGPMGQKNLFYDYSKDPSWAKDITLYFDFSGK